MKNGIRGLAILEIFSERKRKSLRYVSCLEPRPFVSLFRYD